MDYQERIKERFGQLEALKAEYPNIVTSIKKRDDKGAAYMFIADRGDISIAYNQYGFFVNDADDYFYRRYFKTAEEAYDELCVWMHKYGHRFKKFETPKVISGNLDAVTKIPL